jgi:thymidylate synthase ThyX
MTQITAKVIADSINERKVRITTLELEYPRLSHSEFLTHRLFSRNAASSRAIPVDKVIAQVRENPAMPIHWGKKQAGMRADEQLTGTDLDNAKALWKLAANDAANTAERMLSLGGHKQWVNRILEPYQLIKVVVTSTEFDNFFWLRDHPDAQPEIKELAIQMKKAINDSKPHQLKDNEWHLPYVEFERNTEDDQYFHDENYQELSLDEAIKISCSSAAQVSYRKLDTSLEKAEVIYDKLVSAEPVHASAFEHCARASISRGEQSYTDKEGNYYSGNFKEWLQYRQAIPNNNKAYSTAKQQ